MPGRRPSPNGATARTVAGPWPWVLVGWTVVVWGGRVRLAEGATGPLLLALTFLAAAAALVVALVRAPVRVPALVGALATWTVAVWAVRATDIVLGGDRSAAFVAVHVVLAAVSVLVSVLALRAALRPAPR